MVKRQIRSMPEWSNIHEDVFVLKQASYI